MPFSEARAAKRIPASNRVKLLVHGRAILAGVAVNISLGGVYLAASPALPVGSPCEVSILLPKGVGGESLTTVGKVVRTDDRGMAIQFANPLGSKALEVLAEARERSAVGAFLRSYLDYFKVSQSRDSQDCERTFGISKQTFRTLSTVSFVTSIPVAILPVWLLRADIPAAPNWIKILACFVYAGFWLMVLQPLVDLAVIRAIRNRAARLTHPKP